MGVPLLISFAGGYLMGVSLLISFAGGHLMGVPLLISFAGGYLMGVPLLISFAGGYLMGVPLLISFAGGYLMGVPLLISFAGGYLMGVPLFISFAGGYLMGVPLLISLAAGYLMGVPLLISFAAGYLMVVPLLISFAGGYLMVVLLLSSFADGYLMVVPHFRCKRGNAVNCAVSGWGTCSKTCGGGTQTRTITTQPANGATAIGFWWWTWAPAAAAPANTNIGIAFSGWTDTALALAESQPLQNRLPGTKYISLGGGDSDGRFSAAALTKIIAAINGNQISAYAGIAFDIEEGDSSLTTAFANAFAATKAKGLKVIVTVSHSAPYGITDAAVLMRSFFPNTNIDIISPQMYTFGTETSNDYATVGGVMWEEYAKSKAAVVPSIVRASLYGDIQTVFSSKGVAKLLQKVQHLLGKSAELRNPRWRGPKRSTTESGLGAFGPRHQPPPIQAFITSVVSRPFTDLATLLDGFIWKYDKGDFSHWIALFNHFDSFFEKHVKPRKDLQLKFPEGSSSVADGGAEPQFPVEDCLAVLRVSCVILENSGNKHLYSFEYLAPLLASPHPDVATAALQTLVSFIKKTHHASIRWHGHKELNVRLKAMCQGWGGKEEGLDLVTCVAEEDALNKQRLAKATTLHYEFFKEERGAQGQAPTLGATTIHVPGVDKIQASEHEILRQLVAKYNVAEEHRDKTIIHVPGVDKIQALEHEILRQLVVKYNVAEEHRPDAYPGTTIIYVPGVDKIQASEHEILRQLVVKYNVAEEHKFQLLCKIRVCQGFGTLRGRRYVTGLRLMAFYVLFHSNPHQDDVADFFLAEPEFVNELVALCMQEDSVPVVLRALAVRALAVQLLDRSRHSAVCAAINTGGQSGVLSMLLPKVVSAVVSQGAELSATATASESAGVVAVHTGVGIGIGPSVSVAMSAGEGGPGRNKLEASTSSTEFLDALLSLVGALVASSSGCTALTDAGGPGRNKLEASTSSTEFLKALLSLVGALVASSSGCTALTDAGVILLPLLQDYAMEHLSVVATAIKILESFMDFSQNASTMFRDLDGLQAMIQRLGIEVGVEKLPNASSREEGEGKGTEAMATDRAEAKETSDMACEPTPTADAVSVATTTSAEAALAASAADPTAAGAAVAGTSQEPATTALVSAADAGGANSDAAFKPPSVPYARKVLIKFLLRAVAISSYAPTSGTAARPQESDAVRLFSYLRHMFDRATDFGGSLFALAASVVTDLIHHDPLCYRFLDEAGIPDAFINAIQAGVLPYGEAVVCIANTLVALCLNTGGLQKVKDSHVMDCFVPIFTSKKFSRALGGETPGVLGASLDEFFRFVPSLRSDGLDAIINIFKAICILGGDQEEITMAQEQQQQMLSKAQLLLEPSADTSMQDAAAGGDTATATDTATAPPSTDPPSEPIDTAMEESSPQPAPAAAPASTADAPVTPVAAAADPQATPQPAELAPTGSTDAEMTGGDGAVGTTAAPSGADEAEGEAGIPMDTTPPPASADETMNPADEPDSKRLYDFSTVLAQVGNKDTESFLPECINHATRMLENLLSNTETSKLFVENGGVDFLLKIHSLPKLNYTFGFSSASHPLLAVFRGLSPNHAQLLAVKTRDALAKQLGIAMESVTAIGGTCVPSMALEERDVYMKTVSTTAGLIALASAVARNATHMLQVW
eukprot:gene16839-23119_t